MNESHSTVDRLEARIDHQAARVDELYRILKARGIIPAATASGGSDAFFDELVQIEDAPLSRDRTTHAARHRVARLQVGEATGV
jgi:hypothetical protein